MYDTQSSTRDCKIYLTLLTVLRGPEVIYAIKIGGKVLLVTVGSNSLGTLVDGGIFQGPDVNVAVLDGLCQFLRITL